MALRLSGNQQMMLVRVISGNDMKKRTISLQLVNLANRHLYHGVFQNVAKRCPCSLANLAEKARVADFLSTRPPKICSWGSYRFSRDHQSGETKFQKINREDIEHDLHTHIFSALESISVNSWHDSVCWFSVKRYCSQSCLNRIHPDSIIHQGMQIL